MTNPTERSATEVIREFVRVRNKKLHLGNLARDAGVGIGTLEAFAFGTAKLSADTLNALARILFDASYDASIDRMRSLHKQEPPKRFGSDAMLASAAQTRLNYPNPHYPAPKARPPVNRTVPKVGWPRSAGFASD